MSGQLNAVWKYMVPLSVTHRQDMPVAARFLDAQTQHGAICMWFLVDPDAQEEQRVFRIVGTGHREARVEWMYLATVQTNGGDFVWHLFEETAPDPVPSDPDGITNA